MTDQRFAAALARRGLHRSRSVAVSVALVVLALAGLAAGVLGIAPAAGLELPFTLGSILTAPASDAAVATAAVLALLGLVATIAAVTPGRRARHRIHDDRAVVLIDDDVLAGAVSGHTARVVGVAADQVSTTVAPRGITTRVRPTSGHPLDCALVADAVAAYAAGLRPTPGLRTGADVDSHGVVGA
jgi:hypothetical protein